MKHSDMSSAKLARVNVGATLGRKLSEYALAVRLNATGDCSSAYVEAKLAEYKAALERLLQAAIEEGREASNDSIDYENDWAGEARISPGDGNTFVLRKVWSIEGEYWVRVNDVFGGHQRVLGLDEW